MAGSLAHRAMDSVEKFDLRSQRAESDESEQRAPSFPEHLRADQHLQMIYSF